jgi:hypothetical protein
MSSPTNLTDRIAQLRSKKQGSELFTSQPTVAYAPPPMRPRSAERRFATDLFMLFAYSLLSFALLAQLFLIVWLDVI